MPQRVAAGRRRLRLAYPVEAEPQLAAGRSQDDVVLLDPGDAQARRDLAADGDEALAAVGRRR